VTGSPQHDFHPQAPTAHADHHVEPPSDVVHDREPVVVIHPNQFQEIPA